MAQSIVFCTEHCFCAQSFAYIHRTSQSRQSFVLQLCVHSTANSGAIMYFMSTELQKGILLHRASGAASFGTEHCFLHRALLLYTEHCFLHRALLLYTELFFEDRITDLAQSIVFCTEHCFCAQSFVFFEEGITDVTQSFVFGTELRFCHFLTGKPVYFLFTLQKLQNSVCNELFYRFSGLGLKKNGCKCPKSPL